MYRCIIILYISLHPFPNQAPESISLWNRKTYQETNLKKKEETESIFPEQNNLIWEGKLRNLFKANYKMKDELCIGFDSGKTFREALSHRALKFSDFPEF